MVGVMQWCTSKCLKVEGAECWLVVFAEWPTVNILIMVISSLQHDIMNVALGRDANIWLTEVVINQHRILCTLGGIKESYKKNKEQKQNSPVVTDNQSFFQILESINFRTNTVPSTWNISFHKRENILEHAFCSVVKEKINIINKCSILQDFTAMEKHSTS